MFSPRISSGAKKHFQISGYGLPFYELINFENLDVELILTRMPMHDKKSFHIAKNGDLLPGKLLLVDHPREVFSTSQEMQVNL